MQEQRIAFFPTKQLVVVLTVLYLFAPLQAPITSLFHTISHTISKTSSDHEHDHEHDIAYTHDHEVLHFFSTLFGDNDTQDSPKHLTKLEFDKHLFQFKQYLPESLTFYLYVASHYYEVGYVHYRSTPVPPPRFMV